MNSQSLKLESETRAFAFPALMYGVLIAGAGLAAYLLGVLLRFVGLFADPRGHSLDLARLLVLYSGMPVVAGLILIMVDLFVLCHENVDASMCPGIHRRIRS